MTTRKPADDQRDPGEDLRAIAFCLERALEPSYRVKAFRSAAATIDALSRAELVRRAQSGSLGELPGIGKVTALVISESLAGVEPNYLRRVATLGETPVSEGAAALRRALQGDCQPTPTPTGVTAAHRSTRWPAQQGILATPTWC